MIKKIEFRASIPPIMTGIRTGGDGMRLTLDIPESDIVDASALIALRNCPLLITVEVDNNPVATRITKTEPAQLTAAPPEEKPAKKKKAEKPGTHGDYWEAMHHGSWYAVPGVAEILNCEPTEGSAAEALRVVFHVETRRLISPAELEDWASHNGLDNLVSVSRTAQLNAARKSSPVNSKL